MLFMWSTLGAIIALCASLVNGQCKVSQSSLQAKHPLLIDINSNETDVRRLFRLDDSGYLDLKQGDSILIACPGNYNYLSGGNAPNVQSIVVTCNSGWSFTSEGRTITLNSVVCYTDLYHDLRVQIQPLICGNNALIEVGYNVGPNFYKMYDVCFDQELLTPLSTHHYVVRGGVRSSSGTMSAYLFSGVDPSTAYGSSAQTASFTEQLDAQSAKKYITTANMLTYKQLVDKSNFVYGPTQLSTNFYFNTVPVWKPFLNSYWSSLETSIKKLTITDGDLYVFTAPLGIAELPDSNGVEKPVYLHASKSERYIPVPDYLVKSVHNSRYQEVIFVQGVNRGDVARSIKAESLCAEDVCAQLRWLPWAQVPPAQRSVACCAANDPLLLRRLPRLSTQLRGDSPRTSAGLLVGSADPDFYAQH